MKKLITAEVLENYFPRKHNSHIEGLVYIEQIGILVMDKFAIHVK